MATQPDWLITALFKPTADGWVYRAPNPWIFGRPAHYLVNNAQRTQIIEALTLKRPVVLMLCLSVLISGWIALFATAMWLGYMFEQPIAVELVIMLMLIVVPPFAAIAMNAAAMRKRISGVLAAAPLTQKTITYREIRATAARQQPKRSMRFFIGMGFLWVFTGACEVFQLIVRQPRHPLGSDALSYLVSFVLLLAIWLAITYFVQALRSYQDTHRVG